MDLISKMTLCGSRTSPDVETSRTALACCNLSKMATFFALLATIFSLAKLNRSTILPKVGFSCSRCLHFLLVVEASICFLTLPCEVITFQELLWLNEQLWQINTTFLCQSVSLYQVSPQRGTVQCAKRQFDRQNSVLTLCCSVLFVYPLVAMLVGKTYWLKNFGVEVILGRVNTFSNKEFFLRKFALYFLSNKSHAFVQVNLASWQ